MNFWTLLRILQEAGLAGGTELIRGEPNFFVEPGYPSPSPLFSTVPPPRWRAPPMGGPFFDLMNDFIRSRGKPGAMPPSGIPPFTPGTWGV